MRLSGFDAARIGLLAGKYCRSGQIPIHLE
jgi:hypothetical protein